MTKDKPSFIVFILTKNMSIFFKVLKMYIIISYKYSCESKLKKKIENRRFYSLYIYHANSKHNLCTLILSYYFNLWNKVTLLQYVIEMWTACGRYLDFVNNTLLNAFIYILCQYLILLFDCFLKINIMFDTRLYTMFDTRCLIHDQCFLNILCQCLILLFHKVFLNI